LLIVCFASFILSGGWPPFVARGSFPAASCASDVIRAQVERGVTFSVADWELDGIAHHAVHPPARCPAYYSRSDSAVPANGLSGGLARAGDGISWTGLLPSEIFCFIGPFLPRNRFARHPFGSVWFLSPLVSDLSGTSE
jgi:hypothetical protein